MSRNPREHDLDELRKMARERGAEARHPRGAPGGDPGETDAGPRKTGAGGPGNAGADGPGHPDAGVQGFEPGSLGDGSTGSSDRAGLYRELLPLEGTATAEKPYLRRLPESYAGEHLVFEWVEHLLAAGYRAAAEALDYYEAIGWITAAVRSELDEYLRGVGDSPATDEGLSVEDHMRSLVYVAELAAVE